MSKLVSTLALAALLGASVTALPPAQSPLTIQNSDLGNEGPSRTSSLLSSDVIDDIEAIRKRWQIKGISLALVASPNSTLLADGKHAGETDEDGWLRETVSFGVADSADKKVDGDTLFAIASNSKLFTSLAVGLLIENQTKLLNGETLDWNTKIKDILPDWKLQDEYASDHADLIDLMAMRSGMPRHDDSDDGGDMPSVIANLRNLKPSTEFRRAFQYNNQHYFVLSHIIPTLTGVPFVDFVKSHIFDPIGMEYTTYNGTEAKESGELSEGFMRTGHNFTECLTSLLNGRKGVEESCIGKPESFGWWIKGDSINVAGAAGIISSAKDLTKLIKELLDPQHLSKDLIDKISTSYSIMADTQYPETSPVTYGLGQYRYSYRGNNVVGHDGFVPGQISIVQYLPDLGFGLSVMINDEQIGHYVEEMVKFRILDHVSGSSTVDWESRYSKEIMEGIKKGTPDIPKNPQPPSVGWENIEGTYKNDGYGTFKVFRMPSKAISRLLSKGATLQTLNTTGPVYLMDTSGIFDNHILFTHFNGSVFNWTEAYVASGVDQNRHDNGTGTTGVKKLARTSRSGPAVIKPEGIGMYGNFWGGGSTVEKSKVVVEGDVKEASEVWFDKV